MMRTHKPLIPFKQFLFNWLLASLLGISLITLALLIGMVGYHNTEGMSWMDSFANASMILSGMGPLTPLQTNNGKLFAGCYALFSGLFFIAIIGLIFAPVVQRFFHRLHIDTWH